MSNAVDKLVQRLGERRAPSGGYEAVPGAGASTESTALAALVLDDEAARAWLLARQRPDGAWPLGDAVPEPSWASAWALVALSETGGAGAADALARGARWLSAREGRRPSWFARTLFAWTGGEQRVDHDLALRGWPWHADAASWCEPTACALLALRRSGAGALAAERIREGESLLWNRACIGGGWNYGNRRVLGEVLPPYPDTTALVLLSLQRSERRAELAQGFAALDRLLAERASSLALGLAVLARALHGLDAEPQRRALEARLAAGEPPHETRALAFALLALRGGAQRLAVPA